MQLDYQTCSGHVVVKGRLDSVECNGMVEC